MAGKKLVPEELGLLTDLYELTMAQSYHEHGMVAPATFSLSIRQFPSDRSYFVAAGLEDVLTYLEGLSFPEGSVDYLHSMGLFSPDFLEYLSELRFSGDVWAIPEGRLFFADEPILEVTAPIIQAQIVETYLINQVNLQTIIASKAARCLWAARGRSLSDFSLRRAHGTDAAMKVARASYIAGFESTSNVLAGKVYSIPTSGTMAHSYVSSFRQELEAFRAFAASFPDRCILLIDTYDTLAGAKKAAMVAKEMEASGHRLQGVRLDSGDFDGLSRQVRGVLDAAGLEYVSIVASGGLDEFDLDYLTGLSAPINSFGVGTKMGVSADAPWSDMAYKLVTYDDRPVLKLSTGKRSLPGAKQVYRISDDTGVFYRDVITRRDEHLENGVPVPSSVKASGQKSGSLGRGEALLEQVMDGGGTRRPPPSLAEIRDRFTEDFHRLDDRFKVLRDPPAYEVTVSPSLEELYARLERELTDAEVTSPGERGGP